MKAQTLTNPALPAIAIELRRWAKDLRAGPRLVTLAVVANRRLP